MPGFSERLRYLRQRSGLTQQRLADELDISKSSVNMFERGEREPGLELMEKIADFFNVDMNFLYGKSAMEREISVSAIHAEQSHDILDEVDIAFYGGYKALSEDDKEVLRQMVGLMRQRRADRKKDE